MSYSQDREAFDSWWNSIRDEEGGLPKATRKTTSGEKVLYTARDPLAEKVTATSVQRMGFSVPKR